MQYPALEHKALKFAEKVTGLKGIKAIRKAGDTLDRWIFSYGPDRPNDPPFSDVIPPRYRLKIRDMNRAWLNTWAKTK